jgi:hypothetical protein
MSITTENIGLYDELERARRGQIDEEEAEKCRVIGNMMKAHTRAFGT